MITALPTRPADKTYLGDKARTVDVNLPGEFGHRRRYPITLMFGGRLEATKDHADRMGVPSINELPGFTWGDYGPLWDAPADYVSAFATQLATVLDNRPAEVKAAERAAEDALPQLSDGDVIDLDGHQFRIRATRYGNYRLDHLGSRDN